MGVKEISKGRYRIVVEAGRNPSTGNRRRVVRYHEGRKSEADTIHAQLVTELAQGTFIEPAKTTIATWLREWLSGRQDLAPKTLESYHNIIEKHLIPALGALPLDKLQPAHVEKYKNKELKTVIKRDKDGKPLATTSANSVNHYLTVLHAALGSAVEMKFIRDNPVAHIRRPKIEKKKVRALSIEELNRLLDTARNKPDVYRLAYFAAFTGLRRSEILGLKWRQVDLPAGVLIIRETTQRLIGRWVEKGPKSDAGFRPIDITESVVALLAGIQAEQEAKKQEGKYYDDDLVFCQPNGKPVWPSNLERRFRKIADKAKLPDFTFHGLRHTHATLLLSQGEEINVVQHRLGHEKASTTIDLYGHALPGRQKEAAQKLEENILGTKRAPNEKKAEKVKKIKSRKGLRLVRS